MTIAIPRGARPIPRPQIVFPPQRGTFAPPSPAPAPVVVRTRSIVNPVIRLALYLFVFSIPFEMPKSTLPVEVPTFFGAVFLVSTILQPSVAYRRIPAAALWFFGFLWMFGLSTLVNHTDYPNVVLFQFLLLLQVVLILCVASNILRDRTTVRGALIALAFACTLWSFMQIFGIAVTSRAVWTGGARLTVFGQNSNLAAIILSAGLITMLNLRPRVLAWPLAAMIAYALIQTGSRGGLICAAVGLFALIWQGRTAWTRLRSILFGVLALALLAVGVWRSEMLRSRFLQAEEGSLAGRERIYPATLEMISEKPLLGWGPTENQYEIGRRIGELKKDRRDAHDLILELLSATGILGAIPFLVGLGLCIRNAWRARRGALHMLPFALLITVLTGSLSGTWASSKVLWFALSVAVASGAVVREMEKREKQQCAV